MIKLIISEVISVFLRYTPLALFTGCFVILGICMIIGVIVKRTMGVSLQYNHKKLLYIYISYIYCFTTVWITILSRDPGSRDGITLGVLKTYTKNADTNRFLIENILLFIPFGFLLPLLWKRFYKFIWCLSMGFIFSGAIEVCQFLTKRGFAQTDDIIMNCLGTILGFYIAIFFRSSNIQIQNRRNKKL